MLDDNDLWQLVQNEIRIHRKLKHDHVVAFIESFDDGSHVYLVQSLCSNQTLRDLQKSRSTLARDECRYIIYQILKGVEYIHAQDVIHRDIKVANILIDKNMQMKIGDFGLAIRTDDPRLRSCSLCGTTNYLAPEIISRRGFQFCSDIWAVGVIAYILTHGYKPFEDINIFATYARIESVDYQLVKDFRIIYIKL